MSAKTWVQRLFTSGSAPEEVDTILDDMGGGKYAPRFSVVNSDGTNVGSSQATGIGATTDAAATDSTSSWSAISLLKGLFSKLGGGLPASLGQKAKAASLPVVLASDQDTLKVDLATLLAGEDLTNNRLLVGRKPADSDSALTTMQNAAAATGNGTAVNLKGYAGLCIEITTDGSGSGIDYAFEATLDDTNWRSIGLLDATTGTISTGPTALGASAAKLYYLPGGGWGLSQVRARVAARGAGTTTARGRVQP